MIINNDGIIIYYHLFNNGRGPLRIPVESVVEAHQGAVDNVNFGRRVKTEICTRTGMKLVMPL